MKTSRVLVLTAFFVAKSVVAQTNDNPPYVPPPVVARPHVVEVPQPDAAPALEPGSDSTVTAQAPPSSVPIPAENLSPSKLAEYQARFQEGFALEQSGKLNEARAIYDGILAEDPNAKRSLLEAGKISFLLGQLQRADGYLTKLHTIVPDFPDPIELLIQVNQALDHDVKVELLIRDFTALHDSGKIPELTRSICFVRERISGKGNQQSVIISQFFHYLNDPNTVWMAETFDTSGVLKHRVLLNYDADATRALRARDAKYATTQVFTWFGHAVENGQVSRIDAYLQIFALPDYQKFKSALAVILASTPQPIYSVPIDASQR